MYLDDLKILFITTEYPPYIFGGGGIFAYNLTRSLVRNGIEVHVISAAPKKSIREKTVYGNGVKTYRVVIPQIPPQHLWFQIFGLKQIINVIDEIRPSIIHSNSFSAALIFRYLRKNNYRIPSLITLHGYPRHYLRLSFHSLRFSRSFGQNIVYTVGYPLWDVLLLLELKYSDVIVTMSRFIAKSISEDYRVVPSKIVYIPNGIDLAIINSVECTYNNISINREKDYLILSGGRLFYEKGIFLVPYIARRLLNRGFRNILFVIFGDGPYRGFIEKSIKRFNLSSNVKLIGSIPHDMVLELLCASDIVLIPSIYELMPMFMLEALAMKKPIIALSSHYIEDFKSKGIIVREARNIDDFVFKIIDTIKNIDKWREIARKNYEILVKEYDISIIAKRYVNVYKDLLQRSLK